MSLITENELKELMIKTLENVVMNRGIQMSFLLQEKIKTHYENTFSDKKQKENIMLLVKFMEEVLNNNKEIYFYNSKLWKKKNFSGLYFENNKNIPQGIMALTKNVLYEIGLSDEYIMVVNKETPKDILFEAFAYNNLYFFPSKILTENDKFTKDSGDKFSLFWKYLYISSTNLLNDFDKNRKEILKKANEVASLGKSYSELRDIIDSNMFYVKEDVESNLLCLGHELNDIFNGAELENLEMTYLYENNFQIGCGGFPFIKDFKILAAFLLKDFFSSIRNKNELSYELGLLTLYLTHGAEYTDNKNQIVKDKIVFNEILKFINEYQVDDEIIIKKQIIQNILEGIEHLIIASGLYFELNMVEINKAKELFSTNKIYNERYPCLVESVKKKTKTYEKKFKYYLSNDIDEVFHSLMLTTMKQNLIKTILFDLVNSQMQNDNLRLSITKEGIYTVASNIKLEQKIFEKTLLCFCEELLEITYKKMIKNSDIQKTEEYNNCFSNNKFEKMLREFMLKENLGNTEKEKYSKKKI